MKKSLILVLTLSVTMLVIFAARERMRFAGYLLVNRSNEAVKIIWDRPFKENGHLLVETLAPREQTILPIGKQSCYIYPATVEFKREQTILGFFQPKKKKGEKGIREERYEVSRDKEIPQIPVGMESDKQKTINLINIELSSFIEGPESTLRRFEFELYKEPGQWKIRRR